MTQIFIQRDGEQFGPYSTEELASHIDTGAVRGDDLAWQEGMVEWQPVSTLLEDAGDSQSSSSAIRKSRTSKLHRVLWGLVAAFAVLSVILLASSEKGEGEQDMGVSSNVPSSSSAEVKPSEAEPEKRPPSPPAHVVDNRPIQDADLYKIQQAHSTNSLSYETELKDARLRVTGEIYKIDRDPTNQKPYVKLQAPLGGGKFIHRLAVYPKDSSQAARLEAGMILTVVGDADGLNKMKRPQLTSAIIESAKSPLEPYEGIVVEKVDGQEKPMSAEDPRVIHAAKLFINSFLNPILKESWDRAQKRKLFEVVKIEERGNQTLFRLCLVLTEGRQLNYVYSWVMVTEKQDGNYDAPLAGDLDVLGKFVSHSGEEPTVQSLMQIRRANGWPSS